MAGQEYYDDARARVGLLLEKKITKKFFIQLNPQVRWDYNLSRFQRASLDFCAGYKLTNRVKVEANYVFISRARKDGTFSPRHWASVSLGLKHEMGRFKLLYRNMLQARFKQPGISDDAHIYRLYDRNKLTLKYEPTKRFDVYLGGEIFIPLNSPQLKGIERARGLVGTDIKTFRNQELELYFMYQVQLHQNNWFEQNDRYTYPYINRDFIYGVSYNISF
jgi:hypothetical protein